MISPPVGGKTSTVPAVAFAAGASLGALATGGLALAFGWALYRLLGVAAGIWAAFGVSVLLWLSWARTCTISGGWVVPKFWAAYGRMLHGALFGFSMGLGWRTRCASNHLWVLLVGVGITGGAAGLVALQVFAMTRALPVLFVTIVRGRMTKRYSTRLSVWDAELLASLGQGKGLAAVLHFMTVAMLVVISLAAFPR